MKKPRIIIVDDDDNIIGSKKYGTLDKSDIYRVSALWLTNSQEEILLAQRSWQKNHDPGKWGPAAAGTLEQDETYDSNIIKEAEEEIGLKNVSFKKEPKTRIRGKHNHFTQWYFATIEYDIKDFKVQKNEVEAIKWFDKNEFFEELKSKPDKFITTMPVWIDQILEF
jgi:isopentenyldiphosphate isomerase